MQSPGWLSTLPGLAQEQPGSGAQTTTRGPAAPCGALGWLRFCFLRGNAPLLETQGTTLLPPQTASSLVYGLRRPCGLCTESGPSTVATWVGLGWEPCLAVLDTGNWALGAGSAHREHTGWQLVSGLPLGFTLCPRLKIGRQEKALEECSGAEQELRSSRPSQGLGKHTSVPSGCSVPSFLH